MKKVIFFLFLLFPFFTLADSQAEIHGPSKAFLGESFDVQATLKSDENLDIAGIDVHGKENFQLQGTSSQTQIQIINGKSQSELLYSFSFTPLKEGEFTLGPIVIKTSKGEIKSPSLNIKVTSSSQTLPAKQEDNLPNDIFPPKSSGFPLVPLFFFLGFFVLIVLFYFLLSKYLFTVSDNTTKSNIVEGEPLVHLEGKYSNYFHELLKNSQACNKNLFYHTMNELLRKYFEEKGLDSAQSLTFEEIKNTSFFKKNLSSFLLVFSQSYREEFTDGEDSFESREKFIKDILELLR